MNEYDATEIAYKNGYRKGVEDTVREMQKKLKEKLKGYPQRCGDCFKEKVDQIAKEMLEGENG